MKFSHYIACFILGSVFGLILSFSFQKAGRTYTPSFIEGQLDTVYVKGEPDTVFVNIASHNKSILKPVQKAMPSVPDSALFEKKLLVTPDSTGLEGSINVAVTTFPAVDSIALDIRYDFKRKLFTRIDTLKITRLDTLKIPFEKPKPFYDNFGIGFGVASALFTIILLIF